MTGGAIALASFGVSGGEKWNRFFWKARNHHQ